MGKGDAKLFADNGFTIGITGRRTGLLKRMKLSLDIDQSTLSKIERGERQFASEMVPKLAKAFAVEFNVVYSHLE